MSEVKRVEIDHKGLPFFDDKGVYVFYEDYAALQQKLEASEALMLAMGDDSRESRSKLELVVAENAALKESRKRLGEFILEEIDADYPLNMDVKTPATDAMVNEIRAEGVIAFVEHYAGNLRTAGGGDGYHPEPYHDMADHIEAKCELYVDQLLADAAKGGSDDK